MGSQTELRDGAKPAPDGMQLHMGLSALSVNIFCVMMMFHRFQLHPTNAADAKSGDGLRYLSHIDGLRALAILPVVAFHLDAQWVPGGFTGVDIFFVISGFLMTRLILNEHQGGSFALFDFYKRRALRILPAYGSMIVFVLLCGVFVLLPSEWPRLGNSVLASAGFVSNIYFWRTTSYFAADEAAQPLLHTWTLSLEEQFYILLPIFMLILLRLPKRPVLGGIALLTLASLALSVWGSARFETAAFYLLPFRAWEFGVGAVLAFASIDKQLKKLGATLRSGLALLGLALCFSAFLLIDETTSFPGSTALLPVLGGALIVAFGSDGPTGQILRSAPAVFVGRVSYALYLFHWPVIVFYKLRFGSELAAL
ncbi:MAG: acyltransferase, partial [Pseudomonadota bacterium]